MPELPEVETTRRGIEPYLAGSQIAKIVVRQRQLRWPVPANLSKVLSGQRISAVKRRAKYLLLQLEQGHLVIHLGMSGSLRIIEYQRPQKHDHIDLILSSGKVLRYHDPRRFGSFLWHQGELESLSQLADLGPEPLDKAFNASYLQEQAKRRQRSIKQQIMDQQVVVGVGNIYASEALYLSGIDPRRSVQTLSSKECQHLVLAIKDVLSSAIEQGGTTLRDFTNADGKPGYFAQQLHVYGRADEPCDQCGSAISRIVQGKRASYYCPTCQT